MEHLQLTFIQAVFVSWPTHLQERTIFPFFVPTVYFISTLVIRTTIVFNVALAGLRTLNIVRPFHRVKRWPLVVTIVVYISFWIVVIGYHVYKNVGQGLYFTLMNQHLVPIVGYDLIRWVTGSVEFRDHVLISMGVSFAIPTLFTMVFVTIQANSLLKRKRNVGQTAQNRKEDRHVTGTILLITTIFTINSIIYLVWILHYINTDHIPVMWNYFLSSTCQFLTSFLNPLMIILRSTNLKQGVRDKMSPVMASRESTVVTNAVAVARSPTRMPKESYM